MLDFRPIFFVVGLLLTVLGVAMLLPAMVDAAAANPDWQVFLVAAAVTAFAGITLSLTNRCDVRQVSIRQTFLLTVMIWVALSAFGALPFVFSELGLSYTDGFFESVSGITTTGSTVISGLDHAPPGILFWRALLQWLGGVGIVVMAVGLLPILQIGGMQLFQAEGFDTTENMLPRAAQLAGGLTVVYIAVTAVCILALDLAGMTFLEAAIHAMATISTGGFSTSDASVGHFDSGLIDYIVTLFMIVGSLPFVLYLQVARGKPLRLWRDSQVRGFLLILASLIAVVGLWLWFDNGLAPFEALRYAVFNVVSVMTGTGFSTTDYSQWGAFAVGLFFFLMFVGGCAGSTSCGIKIFRFQILYAHARIQVLRLIQPHGVFVPHYNNRPIPETVMSSVMGFFFLFVICYVALAVALSALGLDFITAVSGAGTAIANVGPALGDIIGPMGNFESLPDTAKWLLSAGMIMGRLELYAVLVLLSPAFWRA